MSAPRVTLTGALVHPADELDFATYFATVLLFHAVTVDSLARVDNSVVAVPAVTLARLECFEERARAWLDIETRQLPPHLCAALTEIKAAADAVVYRLHND